MQNSQENTCHGVSFFLKLQRLNNRCFPVSFTKLFRTFTLQNNCEGLLLTSKQLFHSILSKPTFTNFFQKNCSGIYAKQWNLLSVYSRETRGRKEEASPVLFWLLEKVAWKKWPSLGKNSQSKCILEKKLLNFSQLNLFFLYLIILIMKWLLKFPFFHESSLDIQNFWLRTWLYIQKPTTFASSYLVSVPQNSYCEKIRLHPAISLRSLFRKKLIKGCRPRNFGDFFRPIFARNYRFFKIPSKASKEKLCNLFSMCKFFRKMESPL